MLSSKYLTVVLACLCIILSGVVLFELGFLKSNEYNNQKINELKTAHSQSISLVDQKLTTLDSMITEKDTQLQTLSGSKDELANEVSELNTQIAGLSVDSSKTYPFAVPTTGTVGSQVSTYLDEYKGVLHYAVDIWTTTQNGGAISTNKGNPVYSACSGAVESFQPENGGVTIRCDLIPSIYSVPARKVFTYYGHMANGVTNEQYIYLKLGQRVRKGQFIGYQGDLSMFTPGMRNIHLHFSVFTGPREKDGTQNPCSYIGGSCTEAGRFFVADVK